VTTIRQGFGLLRFVITAFFLLFLALVPATPAAAQNLTPAPPASFRTEAAPEPGGIGVQLLDIPTATQNDPRARVYIVDHLAPGVEIQRRILVRNNSSSVQSVRIYPGAAKIDAGNFVGGNDPAVNDLTTWTQVDEPELQLLAGEAVEVMVTITVPLDAPESEQYAVVWAEVRSAPAEGTTIVEASRVGIRMYLSVGPGNGAPANFSIASLTAARDVNGNPTLTARVTNTGGRALDLTGEMTLADGPAGLSAGPFPLQQSTTIAPGDQQNVVFTLDAELPNGPWEAQLELKTGLVEREAVATINFPDAGQGETVAPRTESLLLLISLGGAILVIVVALLWWIRRRHKITNRLS
jgi:hypothetical protein